MTTKTESKADIKPDVPEPDIQEVAAASAPPERHLIKVTDGGYSIQYKGHPDTGWLARTVFDDGTKGEWGKCDGPPKDAVAPKPVKPSEPAKADTAGASKP